MEIDVIPGSIPGPSDPRWKELVQGHFSHEFQYFPAAIMMTRLLRLYKKDPEASVLNTCVEEIHTFFNKYAIVMDKDIQAVFQKEL